jgi:hypothetical protein
MGKKKESSRRYISTTVGDRNKRPVRGDAARRWQEGKKKFASITQVAEELWPFPRTMYEWLNGSVSVDLYNGKKKKFLSLYLDNGW